MTRFALIAVFALGLGFVAMSVQGTEAIAGKPCFRTDFKTDLIKAACAKGGQAEAKKTMQGFVKKAKATESGLECKGCHEKLAPQYPLKADGLDHFHKLGGK